MTTVVVMDAHLFFEDFKTLIVVEEEDGDDDNNDGGDIHEGRFLFIQFFNFEILFDISHILS